MNQSVKRLPLLLFAAIPVLFLFVYHRTFGAQYAYLDEAQQLWRNHDGSNYTMFLVQGRSLTGRVIEQLFGSIDSIADLHFIRIFSLAGWIITALVWLALMRNWIRDLAIDYYVLLPSMVLFICSPAVAIAIGWASCAEIFLATLFGLLSGAMVFRALDTTHSGEQPSMLRLLTAVVFGVCSLFLYQNSFGIFLLPFIVSLFSGTTPQIRNRRMIGGIVIYVLTYIIYFMAFRYQLNHSGLNMADRATLAGNPLTKFLFLFSGPIPKSFVFNLLYHTKSLLPQLLAPVLIALFAISIFIRYKHLGWLKNIRFLAFFIAMLALVYLPSLAVKENFSSYRTMFPFSLVVSTILFIQLFYFIRSATLKKYTAGLLATAIAVTGYYNFNNQLVLPLEKEYASLERVFRAGYTSNVRQVVFIRPGKEIFLETYGIHSVKDEFGNPSTFRDWVPDPLCRLLIQQSIHNRDRTTAVEVVQFPDKASFIRSGIKPDSSSLLIEMDSVINRK